jgi:formylglycine-generating enzyme required for sulfatase activity
MEFLRGSSLTTLIKSAQLGDWKERGRIALEMARALDYLHNHKILHRDIKPDNIHIDGQTRRVRLIDFGIAKTQDMNLTQTGFVIGTPFYMAPEQLKGAEIGPATDVYAFGLVFFEVLTLRRARPAETVERVLQQIIGEPVDCSPLEECRVPEELALIVRDATKADVHERPDGFSGIIARLESWLETQKTGTQPVAAARMSTGRRRHLTFGQTAAAALVAAVIGGLGVGLLGVSVARAHLPPTSATAANPLPVDQMIAIPGGDFEFGEDRHNVFVGPFKIDRTEVTNERYAMFARATHRALPPHFRRDYPGEPVTGITIDEARSYCFAQSKHLPTEMQWERAARGVKGARFPWGDKADESRANVDGRDGHLVAADSMSEGASPEGVLHLIGNAAEWIDETRAPSLLAIEKFAQLLKPPATDSETWYLIKGGSFRRSLAESAADLWLPAPGRYSADDLGFRCVR